MKRLLDIVSIFVLLLLGGCISQFVPQTKESKEMLVVEGLITDKPDASRIRISQSIPLGERSSANPVSGCIVTVSDNNGSQVSFTETEPGVYTGPSGFYGRIGRQYTMEIGANAATGHLSYKSYPVEMQPVPPIDSIYYEKVNLNEGFYEREGCQLFLDTDDPTGRCKYYRWEYTETWQIEIPYTVPNKVCWITSNSSDINVKSTSTLTEDKIKKFPFDFVSPGTDRLSQKYSVLVTQYSLNEEEYNYWEKLENLSEQVGSLYDMIPASIPSNIYCPDDPNEKILGYFSVSAGSEKRFFVKDNFKGLINFYSAEKCVADTIAPTYLPGLNVNVWVLVDNFMPPYWVISYTKGCYDCTLRGTNIKPDFWVDEN